VRRELVLGAVPRDERDGPAPHLADHRRCRRRPIGGLYLGPLGTLQELVEARASEDPDLGGAQEPFPPVPAAVFEGPEDESEEVDGWEGVPSALAGVELPDGAGGPDEPLLGFERLSVA
jgi:hypothetical protein